MKFVLLKRYPTNLDCPPLIEWWNKRGNKLYNSGGGWNIIISTDEIMETIIAKDWDALLTRENIMKTSEYKNLVDNSNNKSLRMGWLAPDGKMHYCKYSNHISYVHLILNSDVSTIEEQGWIHIYSGLDCLYSKKRITHEQAYTAREELGLRVFDEDILTN